MEAVARASTPSVRTITGAEAQRRGPRLYPDVPKRAYVGLAIVIAYAVLVAVQAMPSWLGDPDPVTRGPFAQRWNLFAPDPPSANMNTFVIARYRTASTLRITDPVDVSSAVRANSRSQRLAPPKLVRVVTKLNVALEAHAYSQARAVVAGDDVPRRPDKQLAAYRRLLSSAARSVVPAGAEIVSVRGVLVRTPVSPFERRDAEAAQARVRIADPDVAPPPISPDVIRDVRDDLPPRSMLIFDSGWMPFSSDVEDMKVAL